MMSFCLLRKNPPITSCMKPVPLLFEACLSVRVVDNAFLFGLESTQSQLDNVLDCSRGYSIRLSGDYCVQPLARRIDIGAMTPFQSFSARLRNSVPLSEQTKHLEFAIEHLHSFGFVAGQWLSFTAPRPDGEEITRAYPIASPPDESNRFALCLNRVQDGFMSNFLCEMKRGESIACKGPFGDFILRPPMRDTLFIATGTGVAPYRSMLQWVLADQSRHQDRKLWLL